MRKVLIVAYYFPPVAASGAMRPLAFCRFLESYGWLASVLTTDTVSSHPEHPLDLDLTGKLSPGVRVEAVPHGNPVQRMLAWRDRVRLLIGVERPALGPGPKGVAAGDAFRSRVSGRYSRFKNFLLDWGFSFPDTQSAWLRPAVAIAKGWPPEDIPDLIFATGGPWTSFLVGKQLAEHWGIPLIVDYRDPWTSNPFGSFDSAYLNLKARALEQSVCRTAMRVVANTPELSAHLQSDYPALAGKIVTITNGFDPDSFGSPQGATGQGGRPLMGQSSRAKLELSHFGTVYGKRTPVVLLRALYEMCQEGRVSAEQLCLRFTGAWEVDDPHCEELAQNLEKSGLLRREPPVSYRACLQQMSEADALLVIQPESPLQIPGKIFEYVATRRPLLLIGGEGATANLVSRYRLGLACPNVGSEIRRLLADLVSGSQEIPVPAQDDVDHFNYRRLTGELAQVFDNVCHPQVKPTR